MIVEALKCLTVGELVSTIVAIIGVLSVIIEFSKKLPYRPLTAFLVWIGDRITSNLDAKLAELERQTKENNQAIINLDNKVERKFKEKQRDDDEKEAKRLRANIISFSDACRVKVHHTKTHFENVFRDIDDYNNYCETHDIPNHYIEAEIRYIEDTYKQCLRENKFL